MQKLIALGKIELIHTQDGKEYLTPERLASEIEQVVAQNIGRMSLIDIASYTGVGIEVIEPTVLELCAQGKGSLINGSFITPCFIANFIEELGGLVADLGKVSLSDLTNKHWLPIDFIKETITKSREDQTLKGC